MAETRLPLEAAPTASNIPEYTVGEISQAIQRTLEGGFGRVRVRGELSGFKRHTSGHLYFSLKDADAVLEAVCWRSTAGRLAVKPEDGLEVVATGRITTFAGRSKYQLIVDQLEVAGEGALLKLLEERKRKLAAEGLFDATRKPPLPFLPGVIGVVTSPTGAVIRDILHRLADRFPRHVLVWPVAVQGEGAAEQVARAIHGFNAIPAGAAVPRPDLLIVARGGGSLEDLWAFNEEIVVRAAAASAIPLISAVGHETDTTLIDFAAARRAPTPTAAAEMAVPVRAELLAQVLEHGRRILGGITRSLGERRTRVAGLARGLPDPRRLIEEKTQRLDGWVERLVLARIPFFDRRQERIAGLWARMKTPTARLDEAGHQLDRARDRLAAAWVSVIARAERGLERVGDRLRPESVLAMIGTGKARLTALTELLDSFSYERVLERGFALVRDAAGQPVTAAASVTPGMELSLRFRDGEVPVVASVSATEPGKRPPARRRSKDRPQGKLL